ncbi:MAG: hypothetical protein AUI15_36355 [Actinobacteria bacterium 13_2_20CM_2_66_6]|nr:MAG: hypothetical protein AUI15_36355 [Actinobacteria bacterium 13_2_20CM_2_66_6]
MGFNAETLEQAVQGEPDWLLDRRRTALSSFERLPLPSRTDEEWRRTNLAGLDLPAYARFEQRNGHVPERSALPSGVIFEPLAIAAQRHASLIEPLLFSLVRADRDRFSALHAAFFTGGKFVYVPDGVTIDEPILGQHFSHEGGTSVLPHTLIVAGKGARFNYLDEYIAEGDETEGYRSGSAEIFVGEGAEVGYVAVQKWGRNAWHLADQRARLEKDSTLKLFNVTLGARFSKTRVEASLVGPVARTVYAGLIRIEKGAARSDAYQANRNLVLSDKAKATSIPMLEIDNNDVRCTHGATVGPVDPNHLFYLRSRGIPEKTAKRMIVQGFFGQVLDRIPFQQARELIEAELEARLG